MRVSERSISVIWQIIWRTEIEANHFVPNDSEEWISDLHLHRRSQLRQGAAIIIIGDDRRWSSPNVQLMPLFYITKHVNSPDYIIDEEWHISNTNHHFILIWMFSSGRNRKKLDWWAFSLMSGLSITFFFNVKEEECTRDINKRWWKKPLPQGA